jgi:hypothetical protein
LPRHNLLPSCIATFTVEAFGSNSTGQVLSNQPFLSSSHTCLDARCAVKANGQTDRQTNEQQTNNKRIALITPYGRSIVESINQSSALLRSPSHLAFFQVNWRPGRPTDQSSLRTSSPHRNLARSRPAQPFDLTETRRSAPLSSLTPSFLPRTIRVVDAQPIWLFCLLRQPCLHQVEPRSRSRQHCRRSTTTNQ